MIDEEIKEDALGKADLNLEATVKMIEGKEGAKKAKQSLSQSMIGHVSHVEKVKIRNCTHCGRSGRKSDSADREKYCPAYSKSCNKCGKKGHFQRKCLSKKIQQKVDGDKQSLVEDADANSVSVMRVVANVTKDVHNSQP